MRNRRHILDKAYVETCCLKSTKCRLPAGTRSLDIDLNTSEAMFLCLFHAILSSNLCCKRCALTRALKAFCTGS